MIVIQKQANFETTIQSPRVVQEFRSNNVFLHFSLQTKKKLRRQRTNKETECNLLTSIPPSS